MTKWTIPDASLFDALHEALKERDAHKANAEENYRRWAEMRTALREILTEATSLQYAQGIARDALYPKEGGE